MRVPLVVDTDAGSDDAVALLLAVLSGRAELRAVTTVAGNVPIDQAVTNALRTLEIAEAPEVPVHRGSSKPLVRPVETAQQVHGEDGLGDIGVGEPRGAADPTSAVDGLLSYARDSDGEWTLVTLGPFTNIAIALLRDADFLSRFRHVFCMAGAPDAVGNVSASAEFNVWADPEAAHIVLAAANPENLTWVGWDVSRRDAVMTPADQERLASLGTAAATFAHRVNRTVNDWTTEVTGLAGYDLPDPITMAVALDESLVIERETVHVAVSLAADTRGQQVIDRRLTAPKPNVTLVRRVSDTGFKDMLFSALADAGRDEEDSP